MERPDRSSIIGTARGFRPPVWVKLGLVAAVACAIAVVAAGFYVASVYAPLQVVGGGPDMGPGSLYLRTNSDIPDEPETLVHCSTRGGRFAMLVTLTNTGPFPVTILGTEATPDIPDPDPAVFRLIDFAEYRSIPNDPSSPPSDPLRAATLSPTTLDPGQVLDVWARYDMGTEVLREPGVLSIPYVNVRYATFGLPRTAEISLPVAPGITGDCHTSPPPG